MERRNKIVIAGAGGIAEAVSLIIAELSKAPQEIFIGDCYLTKAEKVANLVKQGCTHPVSITPYYIPVEGSDAKMEEIMRNGDILLDCLPGSQAPRIARFAKDFNLHYVNLTEYVNETNEIMRIAKDAQTSFVLQTGLAPGFINVLAHGIFRKFTGGYGVDVVESVTMKVGALPINALAPHYYGFTWSPAGVATEYLKDCVCIRNFKKTILPALSTYGKLYIRGVPYEENLTSGGAADLPDALEGKVERLDYKTIRHQGHYKWVNKQIKQLKEGDNRPAVLQEMMVKNIPHLDDDQVIIFASVKGKDNHGMLRRMEKTYLIKPQKIGNHTLRAIQVTTAAPMVQVAKMLLETNPRKGIILQSQIEPEDFLNGHFITAVYKD
jgi:saccharopine dehydrogenase-like NADP-dependent oxidoreductase